MSHVTYWDYLKLEQLLQLQSGLGDGGTDVASVDELHFIIVHQVFELWFKLASQELQMIISNLSVEHVPETTIPLVVHHIKRVSTIFRLAVQHFELMETLAPQDFLNFRQKLGSASGFQSFQMREIETLLGLTQEERDAHTQTDPLAFLLKSSRATGSGYVEDKLKAITKHTTLRSALHLWLSRTPINGSSPGDAGDAEAVQSFCESYFAQMESLNARQLQVLIADGQDATLIRSRLDASLKAAKEFIFASDYPGDQRWMQRVRAGILFIESYRDLPLLAWLRVLIDAIVEVEKLFVHFRFAHARMVERIIGRRVGTGGSSGVDYLDQTTKYRIFPELWMVRTLLLAKEYLPKLQNKAYYQFVTD